MSNPTERQPYRAWECPQCGAPLKSLACEYCGSTMIYPGDSRVPAVVNEARTRIELGLVRGTATYLTLGDWP